MNKSCFMILSPILDSHQTLQIVRAPYVNGSVFTHRLDEDQFIFFISTSNSDLFLESLKSLIFYDSLVVSELSFLHFF